MHRLYENELQALWKWFEFETPAEGRAAFTTFANAVNAETEET